MNTLTIILLLAATAMLAVAVLGLTKIYTRHQDLVSEIDYLRHALSKARAELADLKGRQVPKTAPIPDKVRVSNVIQSVSRYTGRPYGEMAAELSKYPSEKIGRHWYYDRTQAEAIREIYKPKKSNK